MAKQCIKCKKWIANRHIGNVCTDCQGIFPNSKSQASDMERYSQYLNKTLSEGNTFLTFPEWIKSGNGRQKGDS